MSDQWRSERRGTFGWSVEGSSDIKAFWVPTATFADPTKKVSRRIDASTARLFEAKLKEHSGEVVPRETLMTALRSGRLEAFAISEKEGGGYLVVLSSGLVNFLTLATESRSREVSVVRKLWSRLMSWRPHRTERVQRTVDESPMPGGVDRRFPNDASLATRLTSNDDATFIAALREAVQFAPDGSDAGILAMEEAMRRRAGREDLTFLSPDLGGLKGRFVKEIEDAPDVLTDLAAARALLREPRVSQDLMMALLSGHGDDGVRDTILRAAEVGGADQSYTFQLLYNHLLQAAKLAHIRGARSWTEQMMEDDGN